MAVRIYLPTTGTAPITPTGWAGGAIWTDTTQSDDKPCYASKAGSAFATKTVGETSGSTARVVVRRYIYGPIEAHDFTDTDTWAFQIRAQESAAKADATIRTFMGIINGSTLASRGYVFSHYGGPEADDDPMENLNGADGAAYNLSASNGDYLALEIGFSFTNTKSDLYEATYDFGDGSGTDLPVDLVETAQYNPWIEYIGTNGDFTLCYPPSPSTYIPKIIMIT